MQKISIYTENINLSQLLKWANITNSGGEAKTFIREGKIKVNGEVVKSPGKKIFPGDVIEFADTEKKYLVEGE